MGFLLHFVSFVRFVPKPSARRSQPGIARVTSQRSAQSVLRRATDREDRKGT